MKRRSGLPLAHEFAWQVAGFTQASLRNVQLPAPIEIQARREGGSLISQGTMFELFGSSPAPS